MILKKIDFISPEITLFYKGSLSHSSIISGIISLVSCFAIISATIYYFLSIFYRERDCPKISNNELYIEDAGIFPLNSSSFFHYISIEEDSHKPTEELFDFTNFNLIGLETYTEDFENDNDLTKYNHWLYGFCNKEKDIKGIENLKIKDFFPKSACIRKFYDSATKKYYEVEDRNFRWPTISHGTCHPKKKFYTLILHKCEQNILNNIFGKDLICKSDEEIEKAANKGMLIHFNFVDQYVDVLDYKEPIKKYFYRIENTIDKDNYSMNNINFIAIKVKTQNGILFDSYEEKLSYAYTRNAAFVKFKKGKIYMGYSLWLNNRVNFYERIYKKIADALSDVGGVSNTIIFIACFINKIINEYSAIKDIESILKSSNINIEEAIKPKKSIELKNINSNSKNIDTVHSSSNSITNNFEKSILSSKTNLEIEKDCSLEKENKDNQLSNFEKNNKDVNNGNPFNKKNTYNNEKGNIIFWKFLIHKISFGKKNKHFKLYEDFREKIISVENLVQSNFHLLDLLKIINKKYGT